MIPMMSSMMWLRIRVDSNRMIPIIRQAPRKGSCHYGEESREDKGSVAMLLPSRRMTIATPRLAPELIPRMEESASGIVKYRLQHQSGSGKGCTADQRRDALGTRDSHTM